MFLHSLFHYISRYRLTILPAIFLLGWYGIDQLYKKLNSFGTETRKMLDKKFDGKVITTGMGSLFLTHFLNDSAYEINNATDVAKCNIKKLHDYLNL